MEIVGKTEDGHLVVSGLFKLFDTSGIPLADLFGKCFKEGLQPSWVHFIQEADNAGWKRKTSLLRIAEALTDCKGKEYSDAVIERLQKL